MNSKDKNYKEYLRVQRRVWEVIGAQRALGYEPLDEPYQRGWDAHWELRKDISRRSDAEDLQFIIDRFGCDVWCQDITFIRWNHTECRTEEVKPYIRSITERTYEKLPAEVKKWYRLDAACSDHAYESFCHNTWWGRSYDVYVCVIPMFFLVKKITKSMVTHTKVIDNLLEQEYSELQDLGDKLSNYRSWYRRGSKSGKTYKQFRNRQFRGNEKREIKKALKNNDWNDMMLPTPKKCILYDMY